VRFFVFVLGTAALWAGEVQPRLPALASVFPQGCQPGRTVQVEVLGEYLDRAQDVIFLDREIHGKVLEGSYTRMRLELTAAPEARLGPHYFRIVSPRGASNLLLFRIGDQPHVEEREPNSTFEQAQAVALPATIDGRLNVDGDFDFFRFHAEQGQSWIFDLRAARNGDGLDAALILLDADQKELAHSEDVFIWDPFFQYTFGKSGDYVAAVQPTHASNDPTFAYQLDIRQSPHLETISPIALRPGATTEATLWGAGLRGEGARLWFDAPDFSGEVLELAGASARVKIRCPKGASEGPHQLAIRTGQGQSNYATFLVDATPAYAGSGPVTPPVSIISTARYRQPERFWFEAREKQTLVFEVRAHRYGSPVDSILRIVDADGKEIAVNDDANFPGVEFNKDSYLMHTFAKAGRYQVEMRNLWKTTGEDFPYELVVRPPKPDFELMLGADNPHGKLKVTAERKEGCEGPIAFEVRGLEAPLRGEIPAGKNDAEVSLPAGARGEIEVVAGRKVAWRRVRIASGGGEGATFATVREATAAPAEQPMFALEAQATTVNVVRGGAAEFGVTVRRAAGFDEPIRFAFENLPAGVTAAEAVALPGSESVKIRLQAAKDARPGRYSRLAVLGRAQSGRVEEAPKISVVID